MFNALSQDWIHFLKKQLLAQHLGTAFPQKSYWCILWVIPTYFYHWRHLWLFHKASKCENCSKRIWKEPGVRDNSVLLAVPCNRSDKIKRMASIFLIRPLRFYSIIPFNELQLKLRKCHFLQQRFTDQLVRVTWKVWNVTSLLKFSKAHKLTK